jgi:hypothetical protein
VECGRPATSPTEGRDPAPRTRADLGGGTVFL